MANTEAFCSGSPLEYAMKSVKELQSSERRAHNSLATPLGERYGIDISEDTAAVTKRLYSAVDGEALVRSIRNAELNDGVDHESLIEQLDVERTEASALGQVMQLLDQKITHGYASREKDASDVGSKNNRASIYVPKLINDVRQTGGTVYMAKTLSSVAKVRMAWDLHDSNEVIVVDEYETWERLLGWSKLKDLPHGKKQIREQLGDQLSDDVLEKVAGSNITDTETKDDSGSRGRSTRTQPTDEVLNIARSSRHRDRVKRRAKDIKKSFDDDGIIGQGVKIEQLICFPTTTDLNLSDHYWVAGKRWDGGGYAAITNCNKGTFEYLNDCDEVWHIEDYLEQADDYEFDTNHGPVTLGTISTESLVLHSVSRTSKSYLNRVPVIDTIPEVLPEYMNNNKYSSPEMPHSGDMLYAPIDGEDVFWMRPELRTMNDPSEGDGILLYSNGKPRDIMSKAHSLSSDYKLYARVRLPDWDFDCTELRTLDSVSYSIKLKDGGFELIETMAKLHDNGMNPFSETPEARWSQ